ncbi:hypothetical protein WJ978_30510 [Achromobacter xylosoxidans]
MLLLHMFAVALAACILVGTALYAYGAFTGEVSKYRRRMNAGAYNAQLYFDQRESLLRSVAASAVRNTDRMSVADTPGPSAPPARSAWRRWSMPLAPMNGR